jgi:hypothetical protein
LVSPQFVDISLVQESCRYCIRKSLIPSCVETRFSEMLKSFLYLHTFRKRWLSGHFDTRKPLILPHKVATPMLLCAQIYRKDSYTPFSSSPLTPTTQQNHEESNMVGQTSPALAPLYDVRDYEDPPSSLVGSFASEWREKMPLCLRKHICFWICL